MAALSTESASRGRESAPSATSRLRVVELPFERLSESFVARWADLERRSVEGNAFLSPHFAIPAVEHLQGTSQQKPLILAVESEGSAELLALGLFEPASSTRLLPLSHLQSWRCEHTLLDGMLVDQKNGQDALIALFEWLGNQGRRWHGVAFTGRSADGELNEMFEVAASRSGAAWLEDWSDERAIIPIKDVPEDCLKELYSRSRRRSFKQAAKRLAAFGVVSFSQFRGEAVTSRNLQVFLELEAMGWKGKEGTALLSAPEQTSFCRQMATRFAADGSLVIYELAVDDVPVASSLNMKSADDLFCFKIGWHPDYASGSPGILNELKLLQTSREDLTDIRLADSCASPGSYVADVWPWKRRLTTGVFTTTRSGTLAASTLSRLKQVKRLLSRS